MTVPRTVIHHPLGALLVVCLLAAMLTPAFTQNDEDLTFDDEGVVRTRPKAEVAPVAAPLQDSLSTSIHKRVRRQNIPYSYDDEDAEGSAIEGSGIEPRIYRVKIQVIRPWNPQYNDKGSSTYVTLQRNIGSAMEVVVRGIQGYTDIKVVDMRRSSSSNIIVTIDITNDWTSDQRASIERLVKDAVDSQALGAIPVSGQDFVFTEHKDTADQEGCRGDDQFTCEDSSVICEVQRCDGIADCPQGDDEDDCGCDVSEFMCDDSRCVANDKKCDGSQDCQDNTDEARCETTTQPTCRSDKQGPNPCNDGTTYACFCDGTKECPGGEDEAEDLCGISGCSSNFLECDNGGQCIPPEAVCDGVPDCSDNKDETDCSPVVVPCLSNEFRCNNGECIEHFRRCDSAIDCREGEDELACPCESPKFECNSGMCIAPEKRCDGKRDCDDGTDETVNCQCNTGQFRCDNGACIDITYRCDGLLQCRDQSDENGCRCRPEEWTCSDGTCVRGEARCDGLRQCSDGSDEYDCPPPACKTGQWTCLDGSCVEEWERCDGVPQCSDGSDENGCPSPGCRTGDWTCFDGSCVPEAARCDGRRQCDDGSDEDGCPPQVCRPDEWTCVDGSCVLQTARCNGVPECLDKSDEMNCPVACRSDEWTCKEGSCVPQQALCDGRYDCPDYSDEDNCPIACRSDEWTCKEGSCVPQQARCDGRYDCPDISDEDNCPRACMQGQWTCLDGYCLPIEVRCDGYPQCYDHSDEENCPMSCRSDEWTCSDGSCVPQQVRCDGRFNCLDQTDEKNCQSTCDRTQWTCSDGSCILRERHCDGRYDCPDYTDEYDCGPECKPDEWKCEEGTCVPQRARCDSRYDCPDYSDEKECPEEACRPDQFRCDDDKCLDISQRCNGYEECSRGEDERGCPTSPPVSSCSSDEFQCSSGECIRRVYICDGVPDCPDGSDESATECAPRYPTPCPSNQFTCSNGECVDLVKRCDRHFDCLDNTDESGCPPGPDRDTCTDNEFRCLDGACIDKNWRCDSVPDCSDASDENDCSCKGNEFQCGDGSCIAESNRCDGTYDCRDGSDERTDCDCRQDEFKCNSGDCIPFGQRCNGYPDCGDRSDEQNCNEFQCSDGRYIDNSRRCDGRIDCSDGSDEDRCGNEYLSLKTYPDDQTIQQSREVVFQCRDEGSIRAPVRWVRDGNRPLPPGTTDVRGRLTMPNIQIEHSGTYFCEAQNVPLPIQGRRKSVYLQVTPYVVPTPIPTPPACGINKATCMNGQCIDKDKVCDGTFDCTDASDEMRCNPLGCEPNEFQCDNKRCVLKTWLCDSDDDCGDGSDEMECVTNPPGSACRYNEFTCNNGNQCIPKSFHCDGDVDCQDGTDEVGCSRPRIVVPPPRNKMVQVSETFTLTCTADGIPMPTVIWRLNWGHVPAKCKMTSVGGKGVLVCPSAQHTDQGAYSCEAINSRGSVFAQPDCIVQVEGGLPPVCQPPQFNVAAVTQQDCLTCFCFGATDQCYSADRYITQLPPPSSDSFSLVGVNQDQFQGNYVIRASQYPLSSRYASPQSANAVQLNVDRTKLGGPSDLLVYFSLPDSHKGQQLSTYGGFLRYKIRYSSIGAGQSISGPDVIIMGNNITLMHVYDGAFHPNYENQVDVKFQTGQWFKRVVGRGRTVQSQEPANREEIMMVLENMELLLIRALYNDGLFVNATLSDVQLDTTEITSSEQGRAVLVEECRCPRGYFGLSCQDCAPNYRRVPEGPWLGRCVPDLECGPLEYGDPANGIPCLPCSCPLTTPNNQFGTSCYLDTDGRVTCNCRQGYQGRRCELCASGYEGNPNRPGESCRPEPVTCMTTFTCSDGSVHPWSRRCDGIKDCTGYEDESECDVCFNSGHKCGDRRCIHFERICDHHADCTDHSDELPHNCLDKLPCDHIHYWTCADPSHTCIERSRHCDGVYDCPDHSDERYCNCTCDEPFHFKCNDGICLDARVRCNSQIDCSDGSDETGCSCNVNTQHTCGDRSCIDLQRVCDGQVDCQDASDEPAECIPNCDPITMHECGDRTCIDIRRVCDGTVDCRDYSDEPSSCSPVCNTQYEFMCRNRECIDLRLKCNGYSDCRDGSDEYSCPTCNQYQFQCGDGSCIDRQQLCDGRPHCNDQSDEKEQGGCCVPPYFFQCYDGSCIDARRVCDRYPDCNDGSDEYECPGECDPKGSNSIQADPNTGLCQCKEYVMGPKCDQCKPNSFYLHETNRDGCIECFCMGITRQCSSSNWYRQQESVSFTNDRQGFELVDKFQQTVISNDIFVDSGRQELVFREFSRVIQEVYYWKLPQRFLGNKISSYGGNLTYSLRYVPAPGGQSSTNTACAVEIYGNDITLKHYSRNQLSATRQETVSVPLYEQYWERQDGQEANREHFLMALADLEYILIKATYTTNSREVGLKEVILDYAEPRNTGQRRAFAVEMCECPIGYQGLSCEDCAIGYTRSSSGVHLGTCMPCECNGNSEECDPEFGICSNCKDNTAGDSCEECLPGFIKSGGRCYRQNGGDCNCDPRGFISCDSGNCQCKDTVRGESCDACQPGFFHLSSRNQYGCLQCWCSGVGSQCFSSNYYRTQLPMQLLTDHGFTFSNRLQTNVIRDDFSINVANNEISFADFASLRDGETYYWSLPQMFTGNRLPSYGGNLTITQRYQANSGGNTFADADIIIRSSGGREFIWMISRPLQPNIEQTYVVVLTEDSFTMNQQPASRSEFLNALAFVDAILIRATLSDKMSATFLKDVIMDTAVPSQTGQPRALEVEQCQCPNEYTGLSCEQCRSGYYKDPATTRCTRCPCNGREESCTPLANGSVRCDCLPGYYGPFCRGSGLVLELRPFKVLFNWYDREVYENFTCSYQSSEPLRIALTREPTLVEDGAPDSFMDTQAPHITEGYTNGATHFAVLRLLNGHRTVACRLYDADNMEVATVMSPIMYVGHTRRSQPPIERPDQPLITVTISEPRSQDAELGSSVQFQCSAQSLTGSQNRVSVTWSKAGGELPFGRATDNRQGLLEINRVQKSDRGIYICAATDGISQIVTQNASLNIREGGPPRIILEERRKVLDVRVGAPLEVRCSAEGSPLPQITWTRGQNRDLPVNVFQQNGLLSFRSAQPSDSGEYYCTATNNLGTDFARIIINVVHSDRPERPTAPSQLIIVRVSNEVVEARSGETVRVSCSAGSPGQLRVEWSRLSGYLPSQAVTEGGELQIPNARPIDSGIYVCRITDERTLNYEESTTRITITQFVNLPTVQIQPDRQTINQGTEAELRCIVSGDPPPVITWSKVNEDLGPGVSIEGSILRITNAIINDRGMYVCTAQNDGGTAQAAAIIEVERREPPVIEVYPELKQTIVVGASALFQCHLTAGIPNPTVRWARTDGRPLTPNTETLNGGVLRFNQVQGDEEGSYTCTAENDAGHVRATAILEIQSLPVITIQPGPSPLTVRIRERVHLKCSAQGDPAPSVTWQRLQANFPSNIPSRSTDLNVAEYEIASATKADEGTYLCSARNSAGVSEERINLTVEDSLPGDRPQPSVTQPETSTVFVPVGGSYEFTCSGPLEANIRFTFQRSDDRPLPASARIENNVLYLTNVDNSASGEYACVGADRISGNILFTIYSTIEVFAPPRITLHPALQVVKPGQNVRIHCSATGQPPITINWSKATGYMPPSVIINGGEIMFRGIKTSDAGRYTCTANNSAGTTMSSAEVIVNDEPLLTAIAPYVEVDVGQTAELRCEASGIDPNSIRWTRIEGQLPHGAIKQGNILRLPFIRPEDYGSYQCEAIAPDGQYTSDIITLAVKSEPTLTATPQYVEVHVGQAAELRCDSSGVDPNSIRWTRLRSQIPHGAVRQGNSLRLPFIRPEDGGRYQCEAITPAGHHISDVITLTVKRHQAVDIRIRPSRSNVRIGDDIELTCDVSGDPAAAVSWSRVNSGLPSNAHRRGSILRFVNVQSDNGGIYMCTVTTASGVFEESFALVVQELISTENIDFGQNTRSVETRSVAHGLRAVMDCRVSLPPPVSYTWNKQGGKLPSNSLVQDAILDIPEVHMEDAGLYICTGSNEERNLDLPILLLVTGIVPRFEESSYMSLATLARAYLTFNIEISFKPESENGLILYNSQRAGREDGDFVSFGMSDGYAEFRFDVGSGPAIIRSRQPLEINQWHTVKLSRDRKEGTMVVNDEAPIIGRSDGRFLGLDLLEPMYLGGVPDFNRIHEQVGFTKGFRGCISRLALGKPRAVDLMREVKNKVGLTSCETCAGNPCHNNGVCQEAYTKVGHKCICPAGFSGDLCEDTGESCYAGVCGTGRCVNKPGGFECYCPFGKVGQRCEQDITIYEPSFGNEAYIAYPTPRALRRFSVDLNFKPENLDDGVLMYCAQKESGEGDFTSLAIRNKRLEFRFNTGSGTATIQSDALQEGQWTEVRANRTDRLGSLMINNGQVLNGESPGSNRGLNLVTPLFIGGVDRSHIVVSPEVGVKNGFSGCVSEIKLMDQEIRLAEALVDSANVGQCGGSSVSSCKRNPCRNNGQCVDSPSATRGYICECQEGYSGHDCEIEPGVCSLAHPCQNDGACIGSGDDYSCHCPLGFAGHHCERTVEIEGSASFSGNSWVEFDQSLLSQDGVAPQKALFEFSTLKSDGLLFWYGQERNVSGHGQDYISVAIKNGYVELSYELGAGPALVRSSSRVDNGDRHTLIVKRTEREGSLKLDSSPPVFGQSPGDLHMLNAKGNIYIGGIPDLPLMTAGAHTSGFYGCIHRLIIGEEKITNFMDLAISGVNVTPCPSSRVRENTHVTNTFEERHFNSGRNFNRKTVISTKRTVHTSRNNIHG